MKKILFVSLMLLSFSSCVFAQNWLDYITRKPGTDSVFGDRSARLSFMYIDSVGKPTSVVKDTCTTALSKNNIHNCDSSNVIDLSASTGINIVNNNLAKGILVKGSFFNAVASNVFLGATRTSGVISEGIMQLDTVAFDTQDDNVLTLRGAFIQQKNYIRHGKGQLINGIDTVFVNPIGNTTDIGITPYQTGAISFNVGNLTIRLIVTNTYFIVQSLTSSGTIETGDQREFMYLIRN